MDDKRKMEIAAELSRINDDFEMMLEQMDDDPEIINKNHRMDLVLKRLGKKLDEIEE